MAAPWYVRFFGGFFVQGADRTLTRFRTQKTATLLAYLAFHRGRAFARETLAEMLWPGPPTTGRHSLSTALCALRQQLQVPGLARDVIMIVDRDTVALSAETVASDADAFNGALTSAERAIDADARIAALAEAVEVYQGEFLPGFYDDWIIEQQMLHSERFVEALCELTLLLESRGDRVAAIEFARRAIQADPLREEAYRELMRLYAGLGEPSAALRHYRALVRVFRHELGENPSPETRALARKIEESLAIGGGRGARCAGGPGAGNAGSAGGSSEAREAPARGPAQRARIRAMVEVPKRAQPGPAGTVTVLLARWSGARETTPAAANDRMRSTSSTRTSSSFGAEQSLRREIRSHGGQASGTLDETLRGVFARAADAVACAAACQDCVARGRSATLGGGLPARLRIALHSGDAGPPGSATENPAIVHATRILDAAHDGQILCSEATAGLLHPVPFGGATARCLGVFRFDEASPPERLYQVDHAGTASRDFPPPRAMRGCPSNLPLDLPRFFGRDEELERLAGMLAPGNERLVTLVGPPGVGKSRLAIEAAARLREPFGGAVWCASLASLRDVGRIPGQILDAMGVASEKTAETFGQLARVLADRPGLVVLDDMEHLAHGAALVRRLLEHCPSLALLVTSREALRLPGERDVTIAPLPTAPAAAATAGADASLDATIDAPAEVPSVLLFVDRARAVCPDFEVDERNAPTVAAICQRLDGVPLAIELAASHVHAIGAGATLAFFEHHLDLPIHGHAGAGPRHSTLRTALDWSHERLSGGLQRFFVQLAVFRGRFTAEAAESICDEPRALDYLADLTDCSLVLAEHGKRLVQFRMLNMVRDFAREHLEATGEACAALGRHCDYYLDLAERAAAGANERAAAGTPSPEEWLEILDAAHENLLAAVERCRGTPGRLTEALRLAVALQRFWHHRGRSRLGHALLADLLARAGDGHGSELDARAAQAAAIMARELMPGGCVEPEAR